MSRSRKHNPGGTIACCKSQKQGKRSSSRKLRRLVRTLLNTRGEDAVLPRKGRELTNQWDLGGDGKQYWVKHDEKWMRK